MVTTSGDDPSTRQGPARSAAFDVLAHVRSIGRLWLLALALALLVGGGVYWLLDQRTPMYQANVSAVAETGAEPGSAAEVEARGTWTAAVVALARDRDVLEDIVTAGAQTWSVDQAADRITAAQDTTTRVLEVRVLSPSPETATRVADAAVRVLDARLADVQESGMADERSRLAREAAALRAQLAGLAAPQDPAAVTVQQDLDAVTQQVDQLRDQPVVTLTQLGSAVVSDQPVAPRPLSTALTAAVAMLLLAAEGLAVVRYLVRARHRLQATRTTVPS